MALPSRHIIIKNFRDDVTPTEPNSSPNYLSSCQVLVTVFGAEKSTASCVTSTMAQSFRSLACIDPAPFWRHDNVSWYCGFVVDLFHKPLWTFFFFATGRE